MKKIFLVLTIVSFISCSSDNNNKGNDDDIILDMPPSDLNFLISLVDQTKNWIEDFDQKELKLFVADSEWNILDTQPENPLCENNPNKCSVQKSYNPESKNLEYIRIKTYYTFFLEGGEKMGDYLILKIGEDIFINIQLIFEKGYEWFRIEKFICNGKEYTITGEIPMIGDIL